MRNNNKIKSITLFLSLLIAVLFSACNEDDGSDVITENPDPRFETGVFTDSRDGNTYNWVKIGDQTWMTQNLRFKADSGCWAYNNDESLVEKYGYLYNWEVAADTNTVPEGWHLPSKNEWISLLDTLSKLGFSVDTAFNGALAVSMASADSWNPSVNFGCPGNSDFNEYRNKSHFSALAAGVMYADTTFDGVNYLGSWWTSYGKRGKAYFYRIGNARTDVALIKDSWYMGLSIRCVKDEENEED